MPGPPRLCPRAERTKLSSPDTGGRPGSAAGTPHARNGPGDQQKEAEEGTYCAMRYERRLVVSGCQGEGPMGGHRGRQKVDARR